MNLALTGHVCIFRTVRVLSSILFTLMAMVLPMAGAQRYICTLNMEFSGDVEDCPMNCCDCGDDHQSVPDCMVKADILPDAELPHLAQLPFLRPEMVVYLGISEADLSGISAPPVRSERHRDPPDPLKWYVKQQRLLI